MKKFELTQSFSCPMDLLLQARNDRYKQMDKFPELRNVKVLKEESTQEALTQVREIAVGDSLPAALALVIPTGTLTLIEHSVFHIASREHKFTIQPGGALKDLFTINGVSNYLPVDEQTSERKYSIEIVSTAFFVGPIIEGAIAEVYQSSLEKDRGTILKFISMKQEPSEKHGE